jgi:hypothetical protein
MATQVRRADEPNQDSALAALDLSELRAVYGEADLRTLLKVALDEFDCQHLVFDAAFEQRQWQRAAQALHRLAGTVAFFINDACGLEPLCHLERVLRRNDARQAARALGQARAVLAAFRAAFMDQLTSVVCDTR